MVNTKFAVSVHIMTYLALKPGEILTSEYLASSLKTNPTVVRRIISLLNKSSLVKSYKGKSGGIELGRPAEKITLKDIYQAVIDKPLVACSDKPVNKLCQISCSMEKIMGEVSSGLDEASMKYFSKMKLSDLTKKVKA